RDFHVTGVQTCALPISQILKRFRQSVLAAAVSGRLTEEWRGTSVVNGWANITLGDIVQSIEAGKNLKCIETPPRENECGIIKIRSEERRVGEGRRDRRT